MQLLVPDGRLDENWFKAIVAQVKAGQQGLIFDTDQISEPTIRDLANEVGSEYPEVKVTEAEVDQDRNGREGAARVDWWVSTGKNGRRLANIKFNQDKVIEVLKKLGGLSAKNVDRAIEILDGVLQWVEEVPAPASVPAPPQPRAVVRTLPNGEPELSIDATESEMRNASVEQLRDLDARRRNPSRQKFEQVTQGSDKSRQLMMPKYELPPMPASVTRKTLQTCSRGEFEKFRRLYGDASIDARLQGRG